MGAESKPRRSGNLPPGVEIRQFKHRESIRVIFTWNGKRRRETLDLPVTPGNIKFAGRMVGEVQNAIARGVFDYATFFPSSKTAKAAASGKHRYLFGSLVDDYIDTIRKTKSQSPSSIDTWAKWSRSRVKPGFENLNIDEIDPPTIRKWIVGMVDEGLSVKSIRNCVTLLSSVLNRAVDDKLLEDTPMRSIKMKTLLPKRQIVEEDHIDPFNTDEITLILGACNRVFERALFKFAFATGLRTGELIALKWNHVDFGAGTITVRDNIVTGENGTEEKLVKMNKPRVIPMLPAARQALSEIRPMTALAVKGDFVFSPDGKNRWRDDHQIRGKWKSVLRRCGVKYRNPYQTRHTFASTLLMNGEPEIIVAKILGHTTVEMVRRHYGRFIKSRNGIQLLSSYDSLGGSNSGEENRIADVV